MVRPAPTGPNATQADYWSGPSGQSWITHEDEMDSLLSPATQLLLDQAGDVSGRDVLDIGCGTGALSLAFAKAGARVTASDISKPLLARTAKRCADRCETLLADAQTAKWNTQYDLVVSRFGVMFFSDPAAAFANIAQALKPGGGMLCATWAPFDENPWWHMPQSIAAKVLGVTTDPTDPHAPGPMGLSDKAWSLSQMDGPDWTELQCTTMDITLDHPGGAMAAGTLATHVGPAARVLNMHDASKANRHTVAQAIATAFAPFETDGTACIPARLHFYSATRV